jgi:four helix bundle protein
MKGKIESFTDLIAWQKAHILAVKTYKMSENFPQKEIYSLTDQMRRSATSVSSNIAEGFSRQSKKEKLQFYYTAKGSLTELQNQFLIVRDVGYLTRELFRIMADQSVEVSKLINGLIKSIKGTNSI